MGALEMLNCEPAIFLRTRTARMRSRNNMEGHNEFLHPVKGKLRRAHSYGRQKKKKNITIKIRTPERKLTSSNSQTITLTTEPSGHM